MEPIRGECLSLEKELNIHLKMLKKVGGALKRKNYGCELF